jgi:hypothetical protein
VRERDVETDGRTHEDDCGPGGELGKEIGCSAWAEGRLRTLTAEGSGEVGGLALLEEDDADDEERDDDVQDDEKIDHLGCLLLLIRRGAPEDVWIGAEEFEAPVPCGADT